MMAINPSTTGIYMHSSRQESKEDTWGPFGFFDPIDKFVEFYTDYNVKKGNFISFVLPY